MTSLVNPDGDSLKRLDDYSAQQLPKNKTGKTIENRGMPQIFNETAWKR